MSRPSLLDLYCGAGGSAVGYHRAGFDVTGVDHRLQKNYPFAFVQADALGYLAEHGHAFDAIHASPPCQHYTTIATLRPERTHPDLLPATRVALLAVGRPWVIENVPGAPMRRDATLCGTMFGLALRRHRWFESSVVLPALLPASCDHARPITGVYGHAHGNSGAWRHGKKKMLASDTATWSREMGIDWMTSRELAQAIPPAYTEWVGAALLRALQPTEAAS